MSRDDWFRNEHWNAEIEARFFDKLGRARDKSQYLKIQAHYLTHREPAAALKLIERFFEIEENGFYAADAHAIAAQAWFALGDRDRAIASYKAALQREREFPNAKTSAWLGYALLVAAQKIEAEYAETLKVLKENRNRLLFPVSVFCWNAASALIHAEMGLLDEAKACATQALTESEKQTSGLRYHAKLGLVEAEYDSLKKRLEKLIKPGILRSSARWLN